MKTLITKTSAALASGVLLCALAAPANALIISYDEIVTGAVPDSPAPWLTANITNGTSGGLSGVNVTLTPGAVSPEFITSIFFSLSGEYTLSDPTTTPDISRNNCNGSAPAGTGPWQMCMSFGASDQWSTSDGAVSFFLRGIRESNFVYNSDGWRSVAHVQGIVGDQSCSSWVGDYIGQGGIAPSNSGECTTTTSVPEPGTLGLLGLGLAGIGLSRRRSRVTA